MPHQTAIVPPRHHIYSLPVKEKAKAKKILSPRARKSDPKCKRKITAREKGGGGERGWGWGGTQTTQKKQMSFCLDKMPERHGAVRLGARTPPGPDDEVRNHINEGGSWHRRSPFGCTGACCFDDRPDELMRYDALRRRVWGVCVCVRRRSQHLHPEPLQGRGWHAEPAE